MCESRLDRQAFAWPYEQKASGRSPPTPCCTCQPPWACSCWTEVSAKAIDWLEVVPLSCGVVLARRCRMNACCPRRFTCNAWGEGTLPNSGGPSMLPQAQAGRKDHYRMHDRRSLCVEADSPNPFRQQCRLQSGAGKPLMHDLWAEVHKSGRSSADRHVVTTAAPAC